MQSLNDDMEDLNNDMDELFRRAAEDYPLNTNGADWNKVMQQMHPPKEGDPNEKKDKKNYRYLLLLLLLPLGFVCGRYVGNSKKGNVAETNKVAEKDISRSGETKPVVPFVQKTDLMPKKVNNKLNAAERVADKKPVISQFGNNAGKTVNNSKATNNFSDTKPGNSISINKNATLKKSMPDKSESSLSATASKSLDAEDKDNIATGKSLSDTPVSSSVMANKITLPRDTSAASKTTDSLLNKKTQSLQNNKIQDKKQKTVNRKFYYSIVAGPDVSTVKLQKTSKTGYSAGLKIGYQINKKISVDAGALWDRKNYYTDGKYLDTNRLEIPVRLTVLNGTGYCDMIEVPINIKYDFLTKKDHSWFVSTGLSDYLMKYEYYNLTYKYYNTVGTRDYGYKNSSADWFSILNISAGYKKKYGKYSNLSIEPYIKLPLRGVGIGKLPVSSTGVYISWSRFFK